MSDAQNGHTMNRPREAARIIRDDKYGCHIHQSAFIREEPEPILYLIDAETAARAGLDFSPTGRRDRARLLDALSYDTLCLPRPALFHLPAFGDIGSRGKTC